MSKAKEERMWMLSTFFASCGWTIPRFDGVKKWDAHVDKLLKDGMLEKDAEYGLLRITPAGILAVERSNATD